MPFRQVDVGGISEDVFVDDRCPTIWQAPRFASQQSSTSPPSETRNDGAHSISHPRDAPLLSTKVKPLQGDLIRKLFKATIEEKKRALEATAKVSPPRPLVESRQEQDVKEFEAPGFRLPAGVGKLRPRVQKLPSPEPQQDKPRLPAQQGPPSVRKETFVPVTPVVPSKYCSTRADSVKPAPTKPVSTKPVSPEAHLKRTQSTKAESIHISSAHGEDVFVETPVPSPTASVIAVELTSASPPVDAEEQHAFPVLAEEPSGKQKKNKKQNRKNKKSQAREQKELAKQAVANADEDLIDDKPMKYASSTGDAFMSGALPNKSDISVDEPVLLAASSNAWLEKRTEKRNLSHSSHRTDKEAMHPTVESFISRHSSKSKRSSKTVSGMIPPAHADSSGAASFISFEEVGEAWVGPVASQERSNRSSNLRAISMASLHEVEEDIGQDVVERDSEAKRSKASTPSRVLGIYATKSLQHVSPQIIPRAASADAGKMLHGGHSSVHTRQSTHSPAHASSHRSPAEASRSIKDASIKTQSRSNISRESFMSKSSKHGSTHGNSPNDVPYNFSSKSSLSRSSKERELKIEESFAGKKQGHRRPSKSGASSPIHEVSSRSSSSASRAASKRSIIEETHPKEHSLTSIQSHRRSRHASTRSFSPMNEDWEGHNSTRNSAKGGSRLSLAPCPNDIPETSSSKHSKIASLIGSVASTTSRLRSDFTFEQIGEGWHEGGDSSDELERIASRVKSSRQASRDVSRSVRDTQEKDEEAHLKNSEHSFREKRRSETGIPAKRHAASSTDRNHRSSSHHTHRESHSHGGSSRLTRSSERMQTPVGTPVHAVISSVSRQPSVLSSQPDDTDDMQEVGEGRQQGPTVFAGRGWITPHPLESSVTERTPAIVLPSNALPNGATLSYEEWKTIQEDGIQEHRNFSMTESDHIEENGIRNRRNFSATESERSDGKRHKDDRYRFPGWDAGSWQEVEPPTLDPNVASTHQKGSRRVRKTQIDGSEPRSEQSGRDSHLSQRSRHSRAPMVSPSEHAWEMMEEGRSPREDSVVSGKHSARAYSEWN